MRNNKRIHSLIIIILLLGGCKSEPSEKDSVKDLMKIAADHTESIQRRQRAVVMLGRKGSESVPAIPLLLEVIKEKNDVGVITGSVLSDIGESIAPGLIAMLKEKDTIILRRVIIALSGIKPPVKSSIPLLINFFTHPSEDIRQTAKDGVIQFSTDAIPDLIKTFKSSDTMLINMALLTLRDIGPDRNNLVLPALTEAGIEGEFFMRVLKYGEVGEGEIRDMFIKEAIQNLSNPDPSVRKLALRELKKINPPANEAILAIEKCLKDENESVRTLAEEAMKKIKAD